MTTATLSYREIASQLPTGAVVTLHDVSWEEYESLLEELGEAAGMRVSFNEGTMQIMTLSPEHEKYARFFEKLLAVMSLRLRINILSFGSATMRKKKSEKGNEPDGCFYVQSASAIGNRMHIDFAIDPPPDVVVEVDIHHDSKDKRPIYAALGVPEIWRYDGVKFSIDHLQQGEYVSVQQSVALPVLTASALGEFLGRLSREGESSTLIAFDEWLQSERPSHM
ncbi:MAG TPA: Uma2 family endonuclease [Blastocatellia bacterium]|nr:Uma2 family endonuclease [Blastocatellia bacterium]